MKSLYKDLVLKIISTQVIMESRHEKCQKRMMLVAHSRCNLINLFILKINSTIIQWRLLIIAKKNLVIIVIVAELALGFFTFGFLVSPRTYRFIISIILAFVHLELIYFSKTKNIWNLRILPNKAH